jgi:hypothetical protein
LGAGVGISFATQLKPLGRPFGGAFKAGQDNREREPQDTNRARLRAWRCDAITFICLNSLFGLARKHSSAFNPFAK